MQNSLWDVIVVGGGPAGLSAALVLGRCRRRVLVCDGGEPRNRFATELHSFVTRDGIPPAEFLDLARRGLEPYPNVQSRSCNVTDARVVDGTFEVEVAHEVLRCRKLLLATGVRDEMPPLEGIQEFYGRSVHHCPYCDGWESRDEPIAVYGQRNRGFEMARSMTAWSHDLVLCTDGRSGLQPAQEQQLESNGIRLIETPIARLRGNDGQLEQVEFTDGTCLPRRRMFFDTPSHGRSGLPQRLGCRIRRNGTVHCSGYEATDVPGVFIAGNVVGDVQLVIFAAAEGAKAAFGINRSLTREDFERHATGKRIIEHPTEQAK